VPTPSLVVAANASLQRLDQRGINAGGTDSRSYGISVRSEVLPGISVNAAAQRLRDEHPLSGQAKVGSETLNVLARLSSQTSATAGIVHSKSDSALSGGRTEQRSVSASMQTRLGTQSDLGIDLTRSTGDTGLGQIRSESGGIRYRSTLGPMASYGVDYRFTRIPGSGAEGSSYHTLNLDFSWLAAHSLGLNARLSRTVLRGGSARSETLVPAMSLRWDITQRDALNLQYNLSQSEQFQPILAIGTRAGTRSVSGRFTHRFDRDTDLDVTFWWLSSQYGDLLWSRAFRARLNKRF